MSSLQMQTTVESQIDKIEKLPPFPLLGNILKSFLTADTDGDIRPLIANIESEPSVSAKVIGLANSAIFGTSGQIKTIRDATARLGLLQLKSIVYSLVLSSRFKTKQCPNFDIGRFWLFSMLQAFCARTTVIYSNYASNIDKNVLYAIGLLQRIGILALVDLNPQQMDRIFSEDDEAGLSFKERGVFGIDHYHVGGTLLKHWHLPEPFITVLEHYNTPDYEGDFHEIIWILKRAKEIALYGAEIQNHDLDEKIGLDDDKLSIILEQLECEASWIRTFAVHL